MASLPDLTTSEVSFVAYWNAIDDGGVTDINPEDVITHSNVQSYTLYDNGVTVQYDGIPSRTFTIRVKEDGWFVAYLDRTEENQQGQSGIDNAPHGPWDIANNWTDHTTTSGITNDVLERAIQSLQTELGNSGSITYATGDVGLYNYEYPAATTVTLLSDSAGHNSGQPSPRFQYSGATTVLWAFSFGAGRVRLSGNGTAQVLFSDGTQIINQGGNGREYGALELLDAGLIPDSATNYGNDMNATRSENDTDVEESAGVMLLWN